MEQAVSPVGLVMPALPQNILVTAFAIVIAALLAQAIKLAGKPKDPRLLIMLVAGAMASLVEGFACHLIHCYHSETGEYAVYRAFNISVPLWLAEVYVVFFGGMTYYLLELFKTKRPPLLKWSIFAATGIFEGVFEMYTSHLGMFQYWGPQPLLIFGFPLYLGFVNATLPLVFAFAAGLWFQEVKGPAIFLFPLLTPPLLGGIYGMLVMVTATGLYAADMPLMLFGTLVTAVLGITLSAWSYRGMARLSG